MSGAITIIIPGVPTAKGRPRIGKLANGRPVAFTPGKTRTREGVVASLAVDAMKGRTPMAGAVAVAVTAILPIPKSWPKRDQAGAKAGDILPTGRPDLDNIVKLVTDGCNGIVWTDDSRITQVVARKTYGETPATIVVAEEIRP